MDTKSGNKRRVMTGEVVSAKMDKTIVVRVERRFMRPVFKKVVRKHNKYKVHDNRNECSAGDQIHMVECRPISKDKHWRLLEIVKKSEAIQMESRK